MPNPMVRQQLSRSAAAVTAATSRNAIAITQRSSVTPGVPSCSSSSANIPSPSTSISTSFRTISLPATAHESHLQYQQVVEGNRTHNQPTSLPHSFRNNSSSNIRKKNSFHTQSIRFSSSAPSLEIESKGDDTSNKKKPKRAIPKKKDAITVTPRAAERLIEIIASNTSSPPPIGIRLGVKRRGCNGLSYTLNYAMEEKTNEEVVITAPPNPVKVFIEPMALFSIVGTVMDWEESELTSEFTFNNPNSKGECGCGESFNV